MPDYALPGGPVKVKIHNNSGDVDISKVKVGVVAHPGGAYSDDEEDMNPAIVPGAGEVLTNTYPTAPTETVCVTVYWTGGDATCCCTDTRLRDGVNEVVATLDSQHALGLWVRPFPTPSRAFACACGEVPEEYSQGA